MVPVAAFTATIAECYSVATTDCCKMILYFSVIVVVVVVVVICQANKCSKYS